MKHHEVDTIFNFFINHPRAMATMATKYANPLLFNYRPEGKIRIRFSLIPEKIRSIVEPNTSTIQERLEMITRLYHCGYDVHLNFSPVIMYPGVKEDYEELFQMCNHFIPDAIKPDIACEVIFLTHNASKHEYNIQHNLPGEDLLWQPSIQEEKKSSYGPTNLRYNWQLKNQFIQGFKQTHQDYMPWCKIRYIF